MKRSGPKPTKSDARFVRSTKALAELLGCDSGTVSRLTNRDDWPFARKAPWQRSKVPAMLRWRAENVAQKATTVDNPMRREKLGHEVRKLKAAADLAEIERDERAKKLVPIEEVTAEWRRIGHQMRNAFSNLASSIVPDALTRGMPMGAAAEFQTVVEAKIKGIMRAVSEAGIADARDATPSDPDETDQDDSRGTSPRASNTNTAAPAAKEPE